MRRAALARARDAPVGAELLAAIRRAREAVQVVDDAAAELHERLDDVSSAARIPPEDEH